MSAKQHDVTWQPYVGQVVRVRKWDDMATDSGVRVLVRGLYHENSYWIFTEEMEELCESEVVIRDVFSDDTFFVEGHQYGFCTWMAQPIEGDYKTQNCGLEWLMELFCNET